MNDQSASLAAGELNPGRSTGTRARLCLAIGAWLTALGGHLATGEAKPPPENSTILVGAEQVEIVAPTLFSGSLLDLPRVRIGSQDAVPNMATGHSRQSEAFVLDPPPAAFPVPILNFDGHGFTGVHPPSMFGDVGMSHYIQTVAGGTVFTVYNKADGSIAAGPSSLSDLDTANCEPLGIPLVLYDHLAGRWLMSAVASQDYGLCVFVSQTEDPISGGWFQYSFTTPSYPDYAMYAVWPDAYYVTTNEAEGAAYALQREQMLAGAAASMQRFTLPDLDGFGFQALTPTDLDGANLPPAGAPAWFVRHRDDEVHEPTANDPSADFLEIWAFSVDWATPADSTFAKVQDLELSDFSSDLCGLISFSCFPQPDPASTLLDPLREVVMWRSVYRHFGTHQALVGSFVTDVDGSDHGGVRWFELRKVGKVPWSLFQEGTHAPDGDNRWLSSIALDREGNIGLGYNITSYTTYPGLRYTGRLATDPLGTLRSETVLVEGSASSFSNRYGNQSALTVDPVDGCTFWFTGEYNAAAAAWSTRIGTFSLCECPDTRFLKNSTFGDAATVRAALTIDVGPDFTVTETGDLTLRAAESVRLMNGTSISSGASVAVEILADPCDGGS